MPIFEYECEKCAQRTEVLQRLNQTIEEVCPKGCPNGCGHTLKRLVSAPRVRFSGTGYYETDEKPKDKQRNVIRKDDASDSKPKVEQKPKESKAPSATPGATANQKTSQASQTK